MKELLKELGFEHLPMLSEFVDECDSLNYDECDDPSETFNEYFTRYVSDYSDFITQPLTKGMFVPCDLEGNVLEEPIQCYSDVKHDLTKCAGYRVGDCECEQYQQAKERVLFDLDKCDNCTEIRNTLIDSFVVKFTIEQAINSGVKLKLKP